MSHPVWYICTQDAHRKQTAGGILAPPLSIYFLPASTEVCGYGNPLICGSHATSGGLEPGEPAALEKLVPLVHAELSRLAHHYMAGERTGHTLQTTALVNEAFLRLVDSSQVRWQNRAHFMAVSAQLMRRILVDFARSRNYLKRGAGAHRCHSTKP